MDELPAFHFRTEFDPVQPTRVRWTVWDPNAGVFKSAKSFATEREAIYNAQRFIDRRQNVWQKRYEQNT